MVQSHSRAWRCFPSAHLRTVCWSTLVQHIQSNVQFHFLAISRPARDQQLCYSLSLASSFPLHARFVMSFISFTAEEVANAPRLEPSLEGLLLSANVKPQIIDAFRVQEVTSVNLMVALDSTEEVFMKTCKQAFGIDTETGDFGHKRE